MADLHSDNAAHPRMRLLIVGAAGALGRWLTQHVFGSVVDDVCLVDPAFDPSAPLPPWVEAGAAVGRAMTDSSVTTWLRADAAPVLAVVAVSQAALNDVTATLPAMLPEGSTIVVTGNQLRHPTASMRSRDAVAVIGLHMLFGTTVERADGQIFALSPDTRSGHEQAHLPMRTFIEAVGGTVNEIDAQRHDDVMRYVQTATHQALLTFVDVISRSGFDLDSDLWANRTPVFELMVALAGRVLAPGQEPAGLAIQVADPEQDIAGQFESAAQRLRDLLVEVAASSDPSSAFTAHIEALREPFPGSLFTKVQQAGTLATAAVQSARAQVARHRTDGGVIGVMSLDHGGRLHVGTVESATATSFVLRDLLVGKLGRAGLVQEGAAQENAKRLGIAGTPKSVEFTLGRVRILTPDELTAELTRWLGSVTRGCKFLIPEAIAGTSAVRVSTDIEGVDGVELVSEEVRLGQRECVVKFSARADRDLAELERRIQHRIDEVFVWPDGVVLPLAAQPRAIGFLGPAGTFSDTAARQLARLTGTPNIDRIEEPDFPSLIDALHEGRVDLAVVPIANSSSGLVDLATAVLAERGAGLVAGGVIDVPIRIDAYTAPRWRVEPGAAVFSHPQVFRQSSSFIAALQLVEHECTSTVEACRRVLIDGQGVALAARGVGEELGLELHRASVGNLAGVLTRFLVMGRAGCFAKPPRTDVTERSVWIMERGTEPGSVDGAVFDELLRGPSGRALLVSSRTDRLPEVGQGVQFLGTIPWSPRTPIVVV
jgi:prephenate dehydratase/prephenate dehydrogenase